MKDIDLKAIEVAIAELKEKASRAVEDAYTQGFNDGVATTPDHKAFHETHKEAQHYGEDGELVVVSGKFTNLGAIRKIYALLKPDYDITFEEVANNTYHGLIALGARDEECTYFYGGKNREGIFDAWVWTA